MYLFQKFLIIIGGVTLFLIGLNFMSTSMGNIAGKKMKRVIGSLTGNPISGLLTGAITTMTIQSSIATNVILVGFVSSGILTFYNAASVIMGANIGTTITAQLVALSGESSFDITAIGSLIAFIGFIFGFTKKTTLKEIGNIMIGFGMIFLGIEIINNGILFFKNIDRFREFFLVKNDLVLFLNGIIITAIVQSSSAVTGVMVVLASNGLLNFESSTFIILGANIGTCFSVIIASLGKSAPARQTAYFNLIFNLIGSLTLFLPLTLYKSQIAEIFSKFSGSTERMIANFHTLFNLFVSIILLPLLKPLTSLIEKIVVDKPKKQTENVRIKRAEQKV